MKHSLKVSVGNALVAAEYWVEDMEGLVRSHLASELSTHIAREPSREQEFRAYAEGERKKGFVGDVVAPTPPPPLHALNAAESDIGYAGAPTQIIADVMDALIPLIELRERYERRQYSAVALERLSELVRDLCQPALQAISLAERTFKNWYDSQPTQAQAIGTTIGDQVFLSMADVATLTKSSRDAARKLIREKGIKVYRFGRLKYVLLEDLMAVMADGAQPGSAA